MNRVALTPLPMTPRRVMNCTLLLMIGAGLGEGELVLRDTFTDIDAVVCLAVGYLCLLWYRDDCAARGLTRSRLLSVAMVALTLLAIPYYLVRSRVAAERARALAAYVGFLFLIPMAACLGIAIRAALL